MPVVSPNSLIVVTGITGYIGSHVCLAALRAGHRVRGTVRSLTKAEELKIAFSQLAVDVTKLDITVIDNLTDQAQIENVFRRADGVVHVALPGGVPGDSDEVAKEAVDSNLAVLRAAAKENSIKRIVFTSSSVAVISPPDYKDRPINDRDWNDAALMRYHTAREEDKQGFGWVSLRYAATKILSERAVWNWVEKEKPSFDVVCILPNSNFGPLLFGHARSTVAWIYALLQNDRSCTTSIPPQWFVDVRDDARLHVLALTSPPLGGKRIWAAAEPFGWNKILAILREALPHLQLPSDVPGAQGAPDRQEIDNSLASEALGGWISLEKSVLDTVSGVI